MTEQPSLSSDCLEAVPQWGIELKGSVTMLYGHIRRLQLQHEKLEERVAALEEFMVDTADWYAELRGDPDPERDGGYVD